MGSDPSHRALIVGAFLAVALAVALPYLALAHWLGFVPLSLPLLAALALVMMTHLVAMHFAKRWFFQLALR